MPSNKAKKTSAKAKDIEISVAEVVDYLKIRGEFSPALAAVVRRKVAADGARAAGLRVTAAELQKAADAFRVVHDLHKATDTNQWLAANGLTVEALEDYLEANILISKLKDKLAKSASKKITGSAVVKECVRDAAYQQWLAEALK
jgi:hypothetical protein